MSDTKNEKGLPPTFTNASGKAINPLDIYKSDDYFGSQADIQNRKGLGTFIPKEMYLTDQEKADRIGGKYFSEPINFLSSALLMGGTTPRDIQQVEGENTKDPSDDFFVDKYTSEIYYNKPVRNKRNGRIQYVLTSANQAVYPEQQKAFEERIARVGSNPIGNAFGLLEAPYAVVGGIGLAGALGKYGVKKGIQGAKSATKFGGDLASDIKYGDTSFSATRGVLPKPTSGVGADVVKNFDDTIEELIERQKRYTSRRQRALERENLSPMEKIIDSAVETKKITLEQADILLSEGKALNLTKGKVAGEDLLRLHLTRGSGGSGGSGGQNQGPRLGFRTATKEDEELLALYKQVMNDELNLPPVFRFNAIKSSDRGFDGLDLKTKNSTVYNLKKLNTYMKQKNKLNGLSEPEIRAVFEKKLPGVLDDLRLLGRGDIIQPSDIRNTIAQEIMKILNVKKIELPPATPLNATTLKGGKYELKGVPDVAYVFKDIKPEDIKKIKKLHNRFLNGKLMTTPMANDVAVLTRNSKLNKMITKDGKVPSLDELNAAMFDDHVPGTPGLTSSEAGNRINRIIDYINGEDIILPTNYDLINPFTVNFPKDKKLAKRLIKDINEKASQGSWFSHYGVAERNIYITQADNVLPRANGKRATIERRFYKNNTTNDSIHEFAGIRTTGKNNLDSYGNFVILIDNELNKALGSLQGALGTKNSSWLKGNISLDEYIDAHNAIVKRNIKVNGKTINAKPYLAEIMKPSEVTKYYTKAERKLFKEKYGMDLVKEANKAGYAYKIPRNADGSFTMLDDLAPKTNTGNAEGGPPINRENFVTPGVVGDDEEKRKEDFKNVQKDIKDLYAYYLDEALSDTIEGFAGATNITVDDVLKDTRDIINKSDRPLEFKPIKDGYKLVTESPLLKYFGRQYVEPQVSALELFEDAYNSVRKGTENDISMKEEFPAIYGVWNYLNSGVGKTPDEQTYISLVDELNRAQETGAFRLSYNIADLFANMVDLGFGTQATAKVKERYDKMIEDGRFSEPETFLGEIAAIGVEFGIPGSVVFKGVNWFRRALKATLGVNLFATPTYSLTGKALLGAKISNVAKRVGTSAAVFGGTDFIAGGPYNTVSAAFKDDPLLFDNTLGYNYEDTEGLNGKELALVNFKNRLRFGADGAIIGGLFPLVGPPLWLATKFGLLKPTAIIGGKTLQLGNELAVKPLSYLASGTLKAPFSPAGKLEVGVPGLREVSQGVAGGTKIFADFLGKDIITRAAVAAMGAKPGLIKQLPDFKDWRMFEVNSADPLKANLKKIDNVFSFFREAGKRSPDQLYLDVKTQNFIKSKSRQIEKMLDSIEVKAYNLANGFLKKYNTSKTSPAGQDYLLDQVLSYIKGQIKLSDLPKELQTMAKELSKEFDSVRNFYKDVLPDESGLKQFLTSNLKSYIRQSFGIFTNPQFKVNDNLKEKAIDFVVDRIRNNESLVQLAIKGSTENTDVAIRNFARQQVDDLLATVKTEGFDPIIQLQKIAKDNLKLDDLVIQTGEELPDVIKKLLGEEQGLRSSVMQTTSSLVTQAANLKNYDRIGELLLQQGRLFASRDEAIRAGVVNPVVVGRVPGLGLLESGITNLYGSKEVTGMLRGSLGQLDKFMESSIYQSMIAYKAGVQTGKTVLSPATQTRNFGSAAAFVLNNGWIGGTASVADAFKITLDDIFGAGRVLNEEDLINNIARKSELGVIDENIVASELSAVLQDIKAGKVGTFGQIASIADNSKLMKTATRLYSGGDNVWKWYGHEYLKSQLKGAFKNIDEVKRIVKDDFGITEFNPKNMYEAVEEYSAMLVRELMPTYSKVPPMIQAIRKIPFIGNFVSFPAEIIRTSFATSALAMKHIASNNATLRAMGYRSLMGQAATLWALNEGARGLGYAMTNITPEQIRTYKDEFAPDYMKFSDLVPISNRDKETGTFKVFDMSRYNPYDLISSTVNNLIVRATDPKTKLDPARVETDVLSEYFNASGPLLDLLNGTLFGLSIGTEGVYEALTGKTKTGSSVWSDSDTVLEKFDKGIMHIANKNEPGVVSSAQRIYSAFAGDVSGTGQPLRVRDEMFKLFGGSTVTVDVPGSFAYKISEFQNTFKDSKVSEGWYSTKNYQNRGPGQLLREYNEMNEEAFRQQYKFYRAVKSAIDSGLMTERQVKEALKDRKIPSSTIRKILRGEFKALSWGEGGLKSRYEKIKNANPDMRFNKRDFIPSSALRRAQRKWDRIKFEDFEITDKEGGPLLPISKEKPFVPYSKNTQDLPVPPIPDTGTPVVQQNQIAQGTGNAVNPETGLTDAQSVYLSPTEKLYYQRNKGTV